jgi:hypothetical protein
VTETQHSVADSPTPSRAYLDVTRLPDGRFEVAFTQGELRRKSYTPSIELVVRQALRAGGIPVRTADDELRQRCRDAQVPLL